MDGFKRPQHQRPQVRPESAQSAPISQAQPSARPTMDVLPTAAPVPTEQPPLRSIDPIVANNDSTVESLNAQRESSEVAPASTSSRRRWLFVVIGLAVVLVVLGVIAKIWYTQQLAPADTLNKKTQRVVIGEGMTIGGLAQSLHESRVIRSPFAFETHARLGGYDNKLKVGTCILTSAEPADEILKKVTKGCHDFRSITFFPGATLDKPLYKSPSATLDQDSMYIKGVLKRAGYADADIEAALKKQYSGALFADKPAATPLEGYVFGETYYVDKNATVEEVLQTVFSQMESVISRNGLVAKFKAHDLNLYQGITLASIVQRELNCEGKPTEERKQRCYTYQRGIAQVFLNRLKQDTSLGSDVTFIYAADQMKVPPTVDIDSPYNTRKHAGLPPGPIASPGELALKSVADPDGTDNMFFIAGDDGLIYFAKTVAEHERNIKQYCQQLCSEL